MKRLVVNADDFGHSSAVNDGVIEAHERGIVTSASLMVRRPACAEAVAYARVTPSLGVGLHVELGEWRYEHGAWSVTGEIPEDAVAAEVCAQLAAFRDSVGHDPSHLDSHQHVHLREPARAVLSELAGELGVPLRHVTPHARYCGDFYAQTAEGAPLPGAISPQSLVEILRRLADGTTELCCHPGHGPVPGSSYADERGHELVALCHPAVLAAVEKNAVQLCTFREVG